ncbi:MAG: lipid-binding protein [Flavobacteriales bacterium]|nr:lipid-binding protein [Flavobacteriales bacterium]
MKRITSILFFSLFYLNHICAQDTLSISMDSSTLGWIGEKVTGQHSGNINVQSAFLVIDNNKLVGGEFDIDMQSIKCTDIENPTYALKLENHLKDDDFFAVDKYPVANFKITNVIFDSNTYMISGVIIIRDIPQEISFPASFHNHGDVFHADATLKIDRTKHDIKYGSGSFFEELGDRMIYNDFTLNIHLEGEK